MRSVEKLLKLLPPQPYPGFFWSIRDVVGLHYLVERPFGVAGHGSVKPFTLEVRRPNRLHAGRNETSRWGLCYNVYRGAAVDVAVPDGFRCHTRLYFSTLKIDISHKNKGQAEQDSPVEKRLKSQIRKSNQSLSLLPKELTL